MTLRSQLALMSLVASSQQASGTLWFILHAERAMPVPALSLQQASAITAGPAALLPSTAFTRGTSVLMLFLELPLL